MPRLPMRSDTETFAEETRAAVRHILQTRHSMPPPSSYLTMASRARG
jgi:hypothetical protein